MTLRWVTFSNFAKRELSLLNDVFVDVCNVPYICVILNLPAMYEELRSGCEARVRQPVVISTPVVFMAVNIETCVVDGPVFSLPVFQLCTWLTCNLRERVGL